MGTPPSENTFVHRTSGNVRVLYPRRTIWSSLASRMGTWFSQYDGVGPVSGGGQKIDVEPLQHLELDIPQNVHEIILVEDCFVGRLKKRAFLNGTTLWFFTILWFIVIIGGIFARFVGDLLWA